MKPLKYPRPSINRRLNISKRLKLALQSSLTDVHKAFEKKKKKKGNSAANIARNIKRRRPFTVHVDKSSRRLPRKSGAFLEKIDTPEK